MIPDDLPDDIDVRPDEALCPVHNLTYNRRLPVCPDCVLDSQGAWA